MAHLPCNSKLYHYDGYCFNKHRIPKGELAIPARKCEKIDQEAGVEQVSTIIS
ncbi:hypothetical protein GOV07_05385 [Candidatus Woesearchaeota archaeon]|nr:hypothetical protein [Candidatus Woesearchaeota archaeon]